jgi:cobalt-zinc-cadmium efflux system membrane fusion protein
MAPWVWSLARRAGSRAPAFLTVAALAGLALWGWRNDWKLSPSSPAGRSAEAREGSDEPAVKVVAVPPGPGSTSEGPPSAAIRRVEFPSADVVARAGIRVQPARVQDLVPSVTAPGMVDYEPERYARLTARASGTIRSVHKEIGDVVRKGDALALVEAADVGRAKADFMRSLAQVKLRLTTLERLQAAAKQGGSVAERTLREEEAALAEARIRLFNDQQALLNLGLPVRLEDVDRLADDQVVRRLRLLGIPADVAGDLDPETLTANLLPLTAPFDGRVVEVNVAMGEVVQGTQPKPLFVVADVRRLHFDLDVSPEDVAEVRVGQPVLFRPDGGAPEVAARVSHISPEVNEKTRRVTVHAQVANEDGRLRPNTFGTGRIVVGERPGAVVVPAEAVQSDGPDSLVFVRVSQTAFETRTVRPGLRQGNLVEVSGVREGDEVVTTGSFLLKSELRKDRIAGGD